MDEDMRRWLRELDEELVVPEFEFRPTNGGYPGKHTSRAVMFAVLPKHEAAAIRAAALYAHEGDHEYAEVHRRSAGYGDLTEPPTTPEQGDARPYDWDRDGE